MTESALLSLAVETVLTATVYATLGAVRATSSLRSGLQHLGTLIAIHLALLATVDLSLGIGVGGVAQARLVLAAEAGAAFALARLLARGGGAAVAASSTSLVVMLGVLAPLPCEAIAGAAGPAAPWWRTVGVASSPLFAASQGTIDILRLPGVYDRTPTALMEVHRVPWVVTVLGWFLGGVAALALSEWRRPAGRTTMLQHWKKGLPGNAVVVSLAMAFLGACQNDTAPKDAVPPAASVQPDKAPQPLDAASVRVAIDKGTAFLLGQPGTDGQIGGHPGVTALALIAIARSPSRPGKDDPRVAPAIASLAKLAKPDGSIGGADNLAYTTALSILAFEAFGAHANLVKAGQRWLAGIQAGEATGVDAKNVNWGGIGYGSKGDADLSNLHFSLEALRETHMKDRPEVFARAIKFIERCQNRSESNDQPWAGNDGGFVYKPGASKAGETRSTGSMTYAGVNTFIYANVDKNDPRVKDALTWIFANYSVDENPGLGQKGLYYYYHMMSQALSLLGNATITDARGGKHDWYAELATRVVSLQNPDGSWINKDETYWEGNAAVATARALLALELGYPTAAAPQRQ